MQVLQAVTAAAVTADLALNLLAVPWLFKLQREGRSSARFQAACALGMAAEFAAAFVLSAWTPPPLPVIGALVALGLYKFALLAIAP